MINCKRDPYVHCGGSPNKANIETVAHLGALLYPWSITLMQDVALMSLARLRQRLGVIHEQAYVDALHSRGPHAQPAGFQV